MLTLDAFFSALEADLARAREAKRLADLHDAPDFNVFRYLKQDENLLSDIIADLLDPRGTHGQGPMFLDKFLRAAGMDLRHSLGMARAA
jgi:hypothetical protein